MKIWEYYEINNFIWNQQMQKKEYFKKHHVQCFNIWTNIENISKTHIKNTKKLFLKSWKCVYTDRKSVV